MKNKINIAELLKDCPMGMELDCTMYNGVSLLRADDRKYTTFPIVVIREDGNPILLTKYGQYTNAGFAKCVIFPKGKTTWEGFHRPFKDGDIVTWKDRGSLVAFIYKERKDVAVVKHHFALYTGSLGTVTAGEISLVENEIVFATEEEKQKLFDAIKDNGYRWNAETKTLEKLIDRNKFTVGAIITNGKIKGKICSRDIDSYKLEDGTYVFFNEVHNWELVPNKFDINTLKTFESRVLVRDYDSRPWIPKIWGKCLEDDSNCRYLTTGGCYRCCIPYNEETKHLLGTTNDCDDFYKTWE